MGWTSYEAPVKIRKGKRYIDRKEECDKLYNYFVIDDKTKEKIGKVEVVNSAVVSSTYYAAVRYTKFATAIEKESSKIFAVVVLTKTDIKNEYNFYYKEMDENCGPCKYDCPVAILNILSPTENKNAIEWREKCNEVRKLKSLPTNLSNLPVGTKVMFKAPFEFKLYKKGESVTVWKTRKPHSNTTYWTDGHYAYDARVIGDEYEIVEED